MALSTDLLHDLYNTSSGYVVVMLLTIKHESFTQPIRISSDNRDIISQNEFKENIYGTISNSEQFVFFPYTFKLPSQHTDEAPKTSLNITNATRELMPYIRAIDPSKPTPKVTMQVILAEDPDSVIMTFPDMSITQINYGDATVSCELSADDLSTEPFPEGTISPSRFKGVFAAL